jgi:hypothetical protein
VAWSDAIDQNAGSEHNEEGGMLTTRTMIRIGVSGALASVLITSVAADGNAQIVPITGPGTSVCALAEGLPRCIDDVVAGALTVVPNGANGADRGGPLHANGGQDVDIAAHHGRMLAR